jgi:prepilin-type N-terminal cleavage/methylation domain-containing protein
MIVLAAMKRNRKIKIGLRGFTMIEMVMVLIVLSILTVVVASRFATSGNELMVETDGLKSSLRYAQIQALNDDTADWGIHFPDATTYRLYKNNADAPSMIPVKGTPGDPETLACPKNCHKLQGNVQIASGVGTTVRFDKKWGRPVDGSGNPIVADISLSLTQGSQSRPITITKNTGFIP